MKPKPKVAVRPQPAQLRKFSSSQPLTSSGSAPALIQGGGNAAQAASATGPSSGGEVRSKALELLRSAEKRQAINVAASPILSRQSQQKRSGTAGPGGAGAAAGAGAGMWATRTR